MSTITTKDCTQICYKDWDKGPVVTFSHGWPLNSDAWDGQMLFLPSAGIAVLLSTGKGMADPVRHPQETTRTDSQRISQRSSKGSIPGGPRSSATRLVVVGSHVMSARLTPIATFTINSLAPGDQHSRAGP